MAVAREAAGGDVEVVEYLKQKPDRATLERLVAILEDPVTSLVRRDSVFEQKGMTDADVATSEQVVEVLLATPRLLQRPLVVKGNRAIVGRPKDRVAAFLAR